MKRILMAAMTAGALWAGVRVNLSIGVGHPIHRPRTVVVRRPVIVAAAPVVYAAPVVWTRVVVAAPPRERLVWEDTETLFREDDWSDTSLRVHNRGKELLLRLDGRAQIDFAEVAFHNGQVQVVDFNEAVLGAGTHRLLDFANGREVESVRLVARSRTPRVRVSVLMVK
ncbi:MAG: hypothetical protein U0Q16_04390 [Bryobacteraceae bacterium]